MSESDGFVIDEGVLSRYYGPGGEITVPDGVTEIGLLAFAEREDITRITLPESLTVIGLQSFWECTGLKEITLPKSVHTVYTSSFMHCVLTVHVDAWFQDLCWLFDDKLSLKVDVRDFSSVPDACKLYVVLSFISLDPPDLESDRGKLICRFLSRRAVSICPFALDHPELLHFMFRHRLISASKVDRYVQEAEQRGDRELFAAVLAYQSSLDFGKIVRQREKKAAAAERKEDAAFSRIQEQLERIQAQLDSGAGISGLHFTVPSLPKAWNSRAELRSYLTEYGAFLDDAVSPETNLLVLTDSEKRVMPLKKAVRFGVPNVCEEEFEYMIGRLFRDEEEIAVPPWIRRILPHALPHPSAAKILLIPAGVQRIDPEAFEDCGSLERVLAAEGLLSIGAAAFLGCSRLERIELPDSLTEIGEDAFLGCAALQVDCSETVRQLVLRSFFRIRGSAVVGGSWLNDSPVLPNGVRSVGAQAFSGCRELRHVTLPQGLTLIGAEAFLDCRNLTGVSLPEGLTVIGRSAFQNCVALKDLVLPTGLTEIGDEAFRHCSALTGITVPEGVRTVGEMAFSVCWALTDIVLPASLTTIGRDAFRMCPKRIIHAPAGSRAEQYAKENSIPFEAV